MTTDTTAAGRDRIGAVLLSGERPARPSALAASLAFGWRGMLKIKHVPEQLIDVTLTPVLFTLMFTYMFGGAIAGSTDAYLQFLLPGVLVMSVIFTTVYSGVALNTDLTKGVVDRFRSLPIPRPAPLVGAVLGDSLRYLVGGLVVLAVGLAWVFTTLGCLMRSPNAVMNAGFMAIFPLTFLSNAFVEPETLPDWLHTFVDLNPISHLVSAVRGLMDGTAAGADALVVVVAAAVLTAVFAPLTMHLYRRHS